LAIALTLVVLLSLVLLAGRERRASNPIFPPSLMKNPTVWRCNAMAICHGAYFVSMLTFTPIYLRVVRDQSVIEIGLLMLPITFGSGLGSLVTGQIVSRIGRSAIFPSVGLAAFAVLLAILGLYAESMSTAAFAWYLGAAALFTGTVMGIVQVTVQAEVGTTMLGTSIGLISLSRALGGATGTALIGATLFATLAATGVEISTELQALLQGGSSDLSALGHASEAEIRGEVAFAFHGVFLLIALYAAIGSALAWTLPRRTI
jgi:predicted MFS family arabinose efflux permease